MKERPILFSAPMVRAILDGTKTQTRRVVKSPAKNMQDAGMEVIKHREPGDRWYKNHVWSMRGKNGVWGDYTQETFMALCPYGKPGDMLWVRETWAICVLSSGGVPGGEIRSCSVGGVIPHTPLSGQHLAYSADGSDGFAGHWRPSIHMPRWASRITLRVTSVRVERLQDISEADAKAEGVPPATPYHRGVERCDHVGGFHALWESINGAGSWDANQWVWVVGFERVQPQRAEVGHAHSP